MIPWQIFKSLDYKQLFGLAGMLLKNPIYAVPTILASNQCMSIAQKEYGSKHHFNNPANAFRHSLWVILIVRRCLKWHDNEEKAIVWAKKFTDWHEDFSPNKALERAMDLHNNEMGVLFYHEVKNKSESEIISFLKSKASKSEKIKIVEDTKKYPSKLVFISKP